MELLKLPLRPNNAEFLAFINDRQNFCPATGFMTQPMFSQQSPALTDAWAWAVLNACYKLCLNYIQKSAKFWRLIVMRRSGLQIC